uniref:Uncharacterized protein n=1 Tax=Rhizophora mucronata TaxID=61149 RepID=A0A2P2NMC8_RHIMU
MDEHASRGDSDLKRPYKSVMSVISSNMISVAHKCDKRRQVVGVSTIPSYMKLLIAF